jgi:hypothetical protein
MHSFYDRIKGAWWERISGDGIGLFEIKFDELHSSVRLEGGRFYDMEGSLTAYSESAVAHVLKDESKILYLRKCWHPGHPKEDRYHGFGEMKFEGSAESFHRGYGRFFDVEQDHPDKTVVQPVQLRRLDDANEISMMKTDTKDPRSLVLKTLREWRS